jgi:hypothetical protein
MPISKIGSKALVDCSVAAVDIADNSITAAKLAGSIANAKLANSSVTINGSSVSLGASANINALDWQSVITADGSTGTTGVAGRGYFINTTSAAHTFTLPVSATRGDTIAIKDYAGTFATFNLTINRNGHKIQGVENNSLISTNRASVVLVYVDVTRGWEFVTESNVADLQVYTSATGGTVTTSGDYKIHTFTGDGSFVVSSVGFLTTVDYVVVAGGGSGGSDHGGGGGAGGYREGKQACGSPHTASPLAATSGIPVTVTTYPITVGAGGATQTAVRPGNPTAGNPGNNSVFSTITSTGGGGGGQFSNPSIGLNGGSGGGAGQSGPTDFNTQSGGSGNTPPVSPPQGNNGGLGQPAGGGGGGAGSVGSNTPSPGNGGPGGSGVSSSITGSPETRAGGGGGHARSETGTAKTVGSGGPGGGGQGGTSPSNPGGGVASVAGTANTGGGGGGGDGVTTAPAPAQSIGAAGGKGIVIIRYKFQ